jgi:hypothetical protein
MFLEYSLLYISTQLRYRLQILEGHSNLIDAIPADIDSASD